MEKKELIIGALFIAVALLGVYWQVSFFGFVWDDASLLLEGGRYRGEGVLASIWSNFPVSENYFRPLVVAAFVVDMWLFGNAPTPMHWHNLAFHISSTFLVGCLVVQFLRQFNKLEYRAYPLLAALLYGLHPMLVEPVAWISGRFDTYVTFWLLLLINLDLWLSRLFFRWISAFILFLLAALSKEMAVAFPVVYLLIRMAWLKDQGTWRVRWQQLHLDGVATVMSGIVLAGVVYLGLRYSALGYLQQPFDAQVIENHFGNSLQHLLLVGKTAGTYLLYGVAGAAFTSPVHYEVFPVNVSDKAAWVSLTSILIFIGGSFVLIWRGNRLGYVVPVFLSALLPVLNIVFWPNAEDLVQERFLSFPLAVTIPLLVVGLHGCFLQQEQKAEKKRYHFLALILGLFVLVNGAITSVVIPIWKNHLSLWTWAVHRAPLSSSANANLAVALRLHGDFANAKKRAEEANRLSPVTRLGDYTLAAIAVNEKQYQDAMYIVDSHIKDLPIGQEGQLSDFLYIKATALHELHRNDEAEGILSDILEYSPDDYLSAMLLGIILNEKGETKRANACWVVALKKMPEKEAQKLFSDGELHIGDMEKQAKGQHCLL